MNIWISFGRKKIYNMLVSPCDQYSFDSICLVAEKYKSNSVRVCCHLFENNKKRKILVHRFILNPSKNQVVDHIDRNALNNTRENLRLASILQNNQNLTRKKIHNIFAYANNKFGYIFYYKKNKYIRSDYDNKKDCFIGMLEARKKIMGDDYRFYNHYDLDKITESTEIKHAHKQGVSRSRSVEAKR